MTIQLATQSGISEILLNTGGHSMHRSLLPALKLTAVVKHERRRTGQTEVKRHGILTSLESRSDYRYVLQGGMAGSPAGENTSLTNLRFGYLRLSLFVLQLN